MKSNGVSPDVVTFVCILKACGNMRASTRGQEIHDAVVNEGLLEKHCMLGNAIVDMYAGCGDVRRAQDVFDRLIIRDIVSWNTIISMYTQLGKSEEMFDCLRGMQADGFSPDAFTFTCILKTCASIGAMVKGTQIHDEIIESGLLGKHIMLGNALVDMYAKCGALEKAHELFGELLDRDTVTWNALITGYSQQGCTVEALNAFRRMQIEGQFPDSITYLSVLSSCSHSGLVNEGQMHYSKMMRNECGMGPSLEHQTCMVDLFSRAGLFDKALEVIKDMGFPSYSVWCTLLGACQMWGNLRLGHVCFEQAIMIDSSNAAAYSCMANIYANAGLEEDAKYIERMRIKRSRISLDMIGG
jgi:pentatricopeptide repeat protein